LQLVADAWSVERIMRRKILIGMLIAVLVDVPGPCPPFPAFG
jgi:hypothetical protein